MELSKTVVDSLAATAYVAYGRAIGADVRWEKLPEQLQEAWRNVATELIVACRNCQTKQLLEAQHVNAEPTA